MEKHRTSNIEHRTSNEVAFPLSFDVERSMFDVRCSQSSRGGKSEHPPITFESRDKNFTLFQQKNYFNALDGLRALSILIVLLHHSPALLQTNLLATLQENGRYGVGFFFVISGFLICTLFLREEAKTGRIDLWKFYGRRALRLLPLYYAVLLLQSIFVFVLHQYTIENQQLFRDKLPSYLFYFSNWLPTSTQGPFFCAWSLAVEEQFYLGFGLLLFLASRRAVIGTITAALLIKIVIYQIFGAVDVNSSVCRIALSYREPILLGVLLAFAMNSRKGYQLFLRCLRSNWIAAVLSVTTVLWLCTHAMQHESSWDSQLLYLLMALVLAALVVRPDVPLLCGRFVVHIGKISYGIYLLHMFVFSAVKKFPAGTSTAFCFLLTSIVTIALASVVYKCFEQPIIKFYKHKLSPLARPAPEPIPIAPIAKPLPIDSPFL